MLPVVHQQDRVDPARPSVRREQDPDPLDLVERSRLRIGRGPGRADGMALAATRADIGIDRHMIAVGRDGTRGADVETARAARALVARMRTQRGLEVDVERFLELSRQTARLEQRFEHRHGAARVGAEVAVALVREQRRVPAQVDDHVAGPGHAVPRCAEAERGAGLRFGQREIVENQIEGAEMTRRRTDPPLQDRELGRMGGQHRPGPLDQDRHVEAFGQASGRVDGPVVSTEHERCAFRRQRHAPTRRAFQTGFGEEGRDLGARRRGLVRPGRLHADRDDGKIVARVRNRLQFGAGARAGHEQRSRRLQPFRTAEPRHDIRHLAAEGARQGRRIGRHPGAAITDETGALADLHAEVSFIRSDADTAQAFGEAPEQTGPWGGIVIVCAAALASCRQISKVLIMFHEPGTRSGRPFVGRGVRRC